MDNYIVLHYDINEIQPDMLKECFDSLTKYLPDKPIIILPKEISFSIKDKDEIKQMISYYKDIIKNLEGVLNE